MEDQPWSAKDLVNFETERAFDKMAARQSLALRATRARGWRVMVGMLGCCGRRVMLSDPGDRYLPAWILTTLEVDTRPFVPDLEDPATLGCFFGLLRAAYAGAVVIQWGNEWYAVETDSGFWDQGNTSCLQEALVCALEAAGARRPKGNTP